MTRKTHIAAGATPPASQIGASLDCLASTIAARHAAADPESYTYRLVSGDPDTMLKKLVEEAHEVSLAAKDADAATGDAAAVDAAVDHLRYEAGDVVYHLLVVLERFGISIDELAAEMNSRMTEDEIATIDGAILLNDEHINRGHHEE